MAHLHKEHVGLRIPTQFDQHCDCGAKWSDELRCWLEIDRDSARERWKWREERFWRLTWGEQQGTRVEEEA